jgi:uncharacterized protein (DUF433 family)
VSRFEEAERLVSSLTPVEKAQLLRQIASQLGDSFPGVEASPEVCGGAPRIVRTRIPVWLLEQARRQGAGDPDLLRAYPSLRADDLATAWAFVDSHADLIEEQIGENEAA